MTDDATDAALVAKLYEAANRCSDHYSLDRQAAARLSALRWMPRPSQNSPDDAGDRAAGWLALLIVDKLGGTDDVPAWIRRSAEYYRQTVDRATAAEDRERALRDLLRVAHWHVEDKTLWEAIRAALSEPPR